MQKHLGTIAAVIAFLALGALAMLRHSARHFADKTERRPSAEKNRPDAVIADEVEKHLRSHPPATERVRRLEVLAKMIEENPFDTSQ